MARFSIKRPSSIQAVSTKTGTGSVDPHGVNGLPRHLGPVLLALMAFVGGGRMRLEAWWFRAVAPAVAPPAGRSALVNRGVIQGMSTTNRLPKFWAACLLILTLTGCGVNEIPTREEHAKAAWGEIENQYQRRADLIPNLVETVKGYAAHEKDVLEGVVRARAAAVQAPPGPEVLEQSGASSASTSSARRSCPVRSAGCWRSSRTIPTSRPTRTSWRCSRSSRAPRTGSRSRRRDYIEAVQAYNTELRTFPGRMWAMILYRDAEPMPVFAADAGGAAATEGQFRGLSDAPARGQWSPSRTRPAVGDGGRAAAEPVLPGPYRQGGRRGRHPGPGSGSEAHRRPRRA